PPAPVPDGASDGSDDGPMEGGGTRAAARQRAWARHTAVATATTPPEDGFGDRHRRRRPSALRPLPGVMLGATMAMVAVTAALTVIAGPLYGYTDRAATDLRDRMPYLESVFGEETSR
ncbi:MAG: mnhD, partial [Modestobacter sp.]|nr:mnhD [Modestobacter sp.]